MTWGAALYHTLSNRTDLDVLGYWIHIYRRAGDPAWELVLGWNLAIAAVAAAGVAVGAAREREEIYDRDCAHGEDA